MRPTRVAVVGGGIAGLSAAHRLLEATCNLGRPPQVCLFEASGRLGGTIRTERADGFLLEGGPDSFISEKPWALALADRLGLGGRLRGTDVRFRRTYVVHRGRLHALPEGFLLLGPTRLWPLIGSSLFSWPGKLRMGLDLVLPRGRPTEDQSLAAFVRRRLGQEALDRVAQPLVGGIYTADPERLSLAATMPRFLALEREHRSVILGLRRGATARERAGASGARYGLFVTLAGGMQELVDALASRLPPGVVRLGQEVVALERAPADRPSGPGRGWRLRFSGGSEESVAAVVLAGPAPRMAPLLGGLDAELAGLLAGIEYASSATVALAYPRGAVGHPLDGFGFVVPRTEGRSLLACTFSSIKYPGRAPEGWVLLRAFVGGALAPETLERDDADLAGRAHFELATLLGLEGPPRLTRVWRHPRSMPQYAVGHLARVAAIEARLARLPGLVLAGAAYQGVGIADCVRSGEEAAARLCALLVRGRGQPAEAASAS